MCSIHVLVIHVDGWAFFTWNENVWVQENVSLVANINVGEKKTVLQEQT